MTHLLFLSKRTVDLFWVHQSGVRILACRLFVFRFCNDSDFRLFYSTLVYVMITLKETRPKWDGSDSFATVNANWGLFNTNETMPAFFYRCSMVSYYFPNVSNQDLSTPKIIIDEFTWNAENNTSWTHKN